MQEFDPVAVAFEDCLVGPAVAGAITPTGDALGETQAALAKAREEIRGMKYALTCILQCTPNAAYRTMDGDWVNVDVYYDCGDPFVLAQEALYDSIQAPEGWEYDPGV